MIEDYITSGVLEAYVLGDLSMPEMAEIEALIKKHPELKQEVERIEIGLEKMALESGLKPPASVKEKLYQSLEFSEPITTTPTEKTDAKIVIWKRIAAVAAVFLVVTAYFAFDYYGKWQAATQELEVYIAQNELQAGEINKTRLQLDSVNATLDVTLNPDFEKILLAGTANAPSSKGLIYWNKKTSEVFLKQISMMDLPEDKVFQLWAIVDGKPMDAGLFSTADAELIKMKNINTASAFAVTIEPRGGSIGPSLETMQIIGEVPA